MKISEVARQAGIEPHTLRFYEREGLLDERFFTRQANNYRDYTAAAVERIQMIQLGQSAGFTLNEIRELLAAWEAGRLTPDEEARYLRHKLAEIEHRLADLAQMRQYLQQKLTHYETPGEERGARS